MYHGRMVVALALDDGSPAAGYLIQVRSLLNKKRKFYPLDDRLYVGPLDPEDEKRPDAKLVFYNTMAIKGDMLIVTNGAQTDVREKDGRPVRNFYDHFYAFDNLFTAEEIIAEWGYEPDSMATPRVALARDPQRSIFAMVTRYNDGAGCGAIDMQLPIGAARGLGTYHEEDGKAVSWSIRNSGQLNLCLVSIPLTACTAQEIADQLYEFSDPELIVAAAGAIYSKGRWEVAHRNRFESLEEFEEYAGQKGG